MAGLKGFAPHVDRNQREHDSEPDLPSYDAGLPRPFKEPVTKAVTISPVTRNNPAPNVVVKAAENGAVRLIRCSTILSNVGKSATSVRKCYGQFKALKLLRFLDNCEIY